MLVDGLDCMVGGIPLSTLVLAFVQAPSFTSLVVVVVDLPLSRHLMLLCFT